MNRTTSLTAALTFYALAVVAWVAAASWLMSQGLGRWGTEMLSVAVGGVLVLPAAAIFISLRERGQ